MTTQTNKHGRRATRGLRPWLLIPKIIAVGGAVGGLFAVLALIAGAGPSDVAQLRQLVDDVSRLFRWVIVPSLIGCVIFGLLLFLQMPLIFLKLRWFQVKTAIIVLTVPVLHVMGRTEMQRLKSAVSHPGAMLDDPLVTHGLQNMLTLSGAAMVVVMLLLVLGRVKPTLRQNWAKAYKPPANV